MSKQWRIPVFWEMCGVVTITANTLKEAIERAKNDASVELPTGNYIDGSFALSLDDPDEIREYYNYSQPDETSVRQAIQDLMAFEKKTCIIYPFALGFEELSEETLLEIEEKSKGHTDADTIFDAVEAVIGLNPQLNDRDFVAAAFALYEKKLLQKNPILIRKSDAKPAYRYIVRRLTPTDCARLQGFPDRWGHPEQKDVLTDEEYMFWLKARNEHAAINGKKMKDYTRKQMLTWYNRLHSDSSEYKMWGNGVALPPTLYCMQGICDAIACTDTERE